MHEMSIAMSIVEIAEETAREANADKVFKVNVDIGELSGVMSDSVLFCYEACATSEIVAGSELVVNSIEAVASCPSCENSFSPKDRYFLCPGCGGPAGLLQGEELSVRSVELS